MLCLIKRSVWVCVLSPVPLISMYKQRHKNYVEISIVYHARDSKITHNHLCWGGLYLLRAVNATIMSHRIDNLDSL